MGAFFRNSIFAGAALTLASYEIGQIIRKKYRSALFHPLFLASVIVILILKIFQIEYEDYFRSARYISFYLTPATVCLALPLYDQLHLLKRNARAAAAGIMSGTLTSFFVRVSARQMVSAVKAGICNASSKIHYNRHWD